MANWKQIVDVSSTQTLTNKTLTTAVLGDSTANTQSASDNSTKVATTAYVDAQAALGDTTLADGKIWVGNGSGAKAEVSVTGDVALANTGAITINSTSVETGMIQDDAVTFDKFQQVTGNSVLVNNNSSTGRVSAIAVGNTQMLIGDGTGFTAATLSGDITMTNAGVVTVKEADGNFTIGGELRATTLNYTDGDLAVTIGDGGTVTTSGDLTVSGNLKVSGTQITTNTEVINVADNTVVLNSDLTTSTDVDAGFVIERGTSVDNATLYWDEGKDRWRVGTAAAADLTTNNTYAADVMQVRIDGAAINTSSTEVPIGHFQYHDGALYLRVED